MEQRPSARRRIMDAALTVFSARGYTAAGVEEIAAAAGIKAPSLYKHFKNKRAIFDAILEDMEQRGDMQIVHARVPMAQMFGYSTAIRSLTKGRASYSMEPSDFALVPRNVREELLAR